MKILISYDGSDHANAALEDLRRAGLPVNAQAILMSIPQPASAAATTNKRESRILDRAPFLIEDVEKAAAAARQASDRIRRNFPAWEVRSDLAVGSVTRVIAKKASQWNPNLLVVGLQECFFGSNWNQFGGLSQKIAMETNCSVRFAQGYQHECDDSPRVLLVIDGASPANADAAVSAVAAREWPKLTEIRVLSVVNPFDYSTPETIDLAIGRAKQLHRSVANELDRTPAFITSIVREGDPKKVILEEAEDWNSTSIFLASGGVAWSRRFLMGGVAGAIIANARRPVELVRANKPRFRFSSWMRLSTASPAFD